MDSDREAFAGLILTGVKETGEEFGVGAYGRVFAVDYHGTVCAAKEVHSILLTNVGVEEYRRTRDNFLRECQQCAELRHPNVVQFLGVYYKPHESSVPRSMPLLVMEKMDESLRSLLERYPNIPLTIKLSILLDVSLGLRYLHSHKIVHRDLSSNNVLLNTLLRAKISDLGVAKVVKTDNKKSLTKIPGTADFMPPEALLDVPIYNTSLDVFSYGGVVLHTATQVWPSPTAMKQYDPKTRKVRGFTEVERRQSYFDQMAGNTKDLVSLVESCLDDDPEVRPTMADVSERVKKLKERSPDIRLDPVSLLQQDQLKRKVEQLQSEILGITEKKDQLNKKYDDLMKLVLELKEQKDQLNKQNKQLNSKVLELTTKKGQVSEQNEHQRSELLQLEEEKATPTYRENAKYLNMSVISKDVEKIKSTPLELREELHYGSNGQWELSMDKVKPRKFLDDEFMRFYGSVREASKRKELARKLLPTMEAVMTTSEERKATVYTAVELMETMDPLVQYCYTAEEYNFQLEGRCRRILDQYDSTYKEMIVYRNKTEMDHVESKTGDCLNLLEESIKAAEEDIASWEQQKKAEDGRVSQGDVTNKKFIAQDLIKEKNDEHKLIKSYCNEDFNRIIKKLGELDTVLTKFRNQRDSVQKELKLKLHSNRSEQQDLNNRLRQLEKEEQNLTATIKQNDSLQEEANEEYQRCKGEVRDIQEKIQKLLEMTNAAIQLMNNMTGCVNKIVQTTSKEKNRVVKDLEQKELHSKLQLRDALMAKIIFHKILMEEVTHNLQETKKEVAEVNKDMMSAAEQGNKPKVTRLKEILGLMQAEEKTYEEKKEQHEKGLNNLTKRCKEVDKKIHNSGIPQLPTIEERVRKWKAEQDKCFDNPDTGQFHSNISQL